VESLPLWIALVATLTAAVFDLRTRRIPNWLTLGALATALVLRLALDGPTGLALAVVGAFAAGFPALVLFRLRAMGGGDVKLLAACGALVGPETGFQLLLASAIAGGGMALAMIAFRRAWAVTAENVRWILIHWQTAGLLTPCPQVSLGRSRGVAVPYGLAIAGGMLFTLALNL
jgi:prepilin peptidase CpaA